MPESGRFRFEPEWRTTLLTLLLLPVLIGLGFWQLQRAEEKAALAASWESRRQQPPAPLDRVRDLSAGELAYLPVLVRGEFLSPEYFLLDNRIQQGRFGHEVVGVMRLAEDGMLVLVNRGWLAADPGRAVLPTVPRVTGTVSVRGHVYVPPGEPYLLAPQVLESGWPKRIQALQPELLASALDAVGRGQTLFPYSVRLDADQPGALLVDWQVVNVSAAKHRGYALQWFAMALALAIIFTVRSSNLWQWLLRRERT